VTGRWRLTPLLALATMWVLLWGNFRLSNVIGGLVAAGVVLQVFPLPPIRYRGRIRPWGVVRFVAYFLRDLVVSSVEVAWAAVRPNSRVRNAVVVVRLRVRSDLNLTATAEALTLIPGSLVIEADRETGVLHIHVFDVKDIADVERFRRSVFALEERLVRAFGSDEEISQLEAPL
jgi:multicomponent Na+:H+ antiporter subunit E